MHTQEEDLPFTGVQVNTVSNKNTKVKCAILVEHSTWKASECYNNVSSRLVGIFQNMLNMLLFYKCVNSCDVQTKLCGGLAAVNDHGLMASGTSEP